MIRDPRLREWVRWLDRTGWAALVIDAQEKLVWISDEFKAFLHEHDDARLGVGQHIAVAMASPVWLSTITAESAVELLTHALPFFVPADRSMVEQLAARLDERLRPLLASISPATQPDLWSGSFDYVPAPGMQPYDVDYLVTRLRGEDGAVLGSCMVSQVGVRPTLLAQLARGDAGMHERMANLVTPGRHDAAILFADLQGSGDVSRRMPTARYFALIQQLTTQFDGAVADNVGVVGKHSGDGWTAFFLAADAGGRELAALSALRTTRRLQASVDAVRPDLPSLELCLNAGLHWGNLYMGQLVPGGRLDVSALGDEVNECARIQETARDGVVLASKAFVELLSPEACAELGVHPECLTYQPLSAVPAVSAKAVRDAGTLAVSAL